MILFFELFYTKVNIGGKMLRNAEYIYNNIIIADEKDTTKKYCKKAQVGVDVTLKEVYSISGCGATLKNKSLIPDYKQVPKEYNMEIKSSKGIFTVDGWKLPKGDYIVKINEGVQFGPNDTGLFIQRSSLNRSGVGIVSSVWDPGFTTQDGDTINAPTLRLTVEDEIIIEENARIAQLIVFENEDTEEYDGQFQGGREKSKLA